MILDVPVSDVAAAVLFYRAAFGATAATNGSDEGGPSDGAIHLSLAQVTLRVLDESTHSPDPADARHYRKGKTPRLELRVDGDIQAWIDRAIEAGAQLCARLPPDESAAIQYAQILDPFGHLWSFAPDS